MQQEKEEPIHVGVGGEDANGQRSVGLTELAAIWTISGLPSSLAACSERSSTARAKSGINDSGEIAIPKAFD